MALAPGSRGMGALRQQPDHRDVPLDMAALPIQHAALPASVDLRPLFPPIHDQGQSNACTAYSSVDAFVYQRRKQNLKPAMGNPSHVFTYWYTRKREGTAGQDVGANIRDAFKSLCTEGLVQEQNWPDGQAQLEMDPEGWWQSVNHPWTRPPYELNGAYEIASDPTVVGKHHRGVTYRAVPSDPAAIRLSLANGFPIVFGFEVHQSFWDVGQDGLVPLPSASGDPIVGAHAVVACAYDQHPTHPLIVRNSWSASWGDHGYFRVPDAWFSSGFTFDCWTWHAAAG